MLVEIPLGMMHCNGTIQDGNLEGKPCNRLIRQPSPKIPVKKCPRCHTEHVFKRST